MADRIAVFNDGHIMQLGTPEDVYRRPCSRFVADFVGSSNVLPPDFVARHAGAPRWASLRPEAVRASNAGRTARSPASSPTRNFLGASTRIAIAVEGLRLHAVLPAAQAAPTEGEAVSLGLERRRPPPDGRRSDERRRPMPSCPVAAACSARWRTCFWRRPGLLLA